MPNLFRLKLKPTSPWRTPWQADTLTGMLLATAARTLGAETLRLRLIEPMLSGHPPFVLSDALPGDLLPFPIYLRLSVSPDTTLLKKLKRARWLSQEDFHAARSGRRPSPEALLADSDVFRHATRRHNSLSRVTDASLSAEEGGGIFQRPEFLLEAQEQAREYLSVYLRILDRGSADLLLELFQQLSLTGFGADTATGRGQFDLPEDPEPARHLDEPPSHANGIISLSSFQPSPADPTDGYWEAFPKFGKLGPDLDVSDIRKNTLLLFRPGTCFKCDPARRCLGRAIPMGELLQPTTCAQLTVRNLNVIHPAFGLPIPMYFDLE